MKNNEELAPVRCGCGGEAEVIQWGTNRPQEQYEVYCDGCGISTEFYPTKAGAIQAWNRAMGVVDKDINVPNKTAKVTTVEKPIEGSDKMITVMACEKCRSVVSIFDKYCSGCGCRLE